MDTDSFTSEEMVFILNMLIFVQFSVDHFCTELISERSNLQSSADFMTRNIF
jgi:hypothetical protein